MTEAKEYFLKKVSKYQISKETILYIKNNIQNNIKTRKESFSISTKH